MHNNNRFYRMLGLAVRAGGVVFGEGGTCDCIRSKRAALVIIACDASANTRKRIKNCCAYYSVDMAEYGDRYELGRCTGKEIAVVMAVTDSGLAKSLKDILTADASDRKKAADEF